MAVQQPPCNWLTCQACQQDLMMQQWSALCLPDLQLVCRAAKGMTIYWCSPTLRRHLRRLGAAVLGQLEAKAGTATVAAVSIVSGLPRLLPLPKT